jgi:hypothetical protein
MTIEEIETELGTRILLLTHGGSLKVTHTNSGLVQICVGGINPLELTFDSREALTLIEFLAIALKPSSNNQIITLNEENNGDGKWTPKCGLSPYRVICASSHECGKQYLTFRAYEDQLHAQCDRWACPECGYEATWDSAWYEGYAEEIRIEESSNRKKFK